MTVDPLHSLTTAWDKISASDEAITALHYWQKSESGLSAFGTPDELVAELTKASGCADYAATDAMLHLLLRVAGGDGAGSTAAATLVAARMVPAAGSIIGQLLSATRRSGRRLSVLDARVTVAGCLWEQVRTYPLGRSSRVAANLRAEVLKHSLMAEGVHPRCPRAGIPTDPATLAELISDAPTGPRASEELVHLLAWAVTEHVLSRTQSDLLLLRWTDGTIPVPTRELALRMGVPQRTVAHRCARAEQLLAAAVRTR